MALIRLAHPFPSLLNALATAAVATLAGATPGTAIRLGAGMLALQASIGALNDLVDAPLDASVKPAKPIPAGLATPRSAALLAAAGLVLGLALSAPSGPIVVAIAAAGVGLGYVYDLRLSRTAFSWLPLALALPLVPLYAWLGAGALVPPGLLTLLPIAVLAGAGLLLANGLVDLERDAASGRWGSGVRLGRRRAWLAHALVLGVAAALAIALAPGGSAGAAGVPGTPGAGGSPASGAGLPPSVLAALRSWGLVLGAAALALGAALLADDRPARRERGWELESVGVAALGLGWLAGTALAAAAIA